MSRFRRFHKPTSAAAATSNSLQVTLKQARKTGVLNLSNKELESVPESVWLLNVLTDDERSNPVFGSSESNWWEQEDLRKLYLSSNKLTSISEDIKKFPGLQILDLQDNELAELPVCLGQLENLQQLNVSHNQLAALEFAFTSAENLTVLRVQNNKIEQISAEFFSALKNCQQINFANNSLKALPRSIVSLEHVRDLNLSNNHLCELPSEIGSLHALSVLDLSNNSLITLPESVGRLKSLSQLFVRMNRLTSLPDLSACECLKELGVSNNFLPTLNPATLPRGLTKLELRDNKLKTLSVDIVLLEALQRLDLANNDLQQVSPEISLMDNLKVITLEGNPIRSIRRDVINRGSDAILKYLKTRLIPAESGDPAANGSALPQSSKTEALTKSHAIATSKKLTLTSVDAGAIEGELKQLTEVQLVEMTLSKCKLTAVPVAVFSFRESLTKLCLSHNALTEIPQTLCVLTGLTHLNLSCNALTGLPAEITQLSALMEINIMSNRFEELPCGLFQIGTLEHILADENKMTTIDVASLKGLARLSTLSLRNNYIKSVPPELGLLEQIKSLCIDGNVFRVPRQAIVQKGTIAILEYLRSRIVT